MKKTATVSLVCGAIVLSAFAVINNISWQITDGYSIKFSNPEANGIFSKFTGDIVFDEKNLNHSSFNVSIDVSSINTGNGMKNRHAKSDNWFDAKQFPEIRFTSSTVSKKNDSYEVLGILEMHGVKKQIMFPFTFKDNVFNGTFTINRIDYGIGSTKGMSGKVPVEIKVDIMVPVTKK